MRYLSFDYGLKRIGLAGSDSGVIARPLEIISSDDPSLNLAKITLAVKKYAPEEIVFGYPINDNGSLGPQANYTQEIITELKKAFPQIQIHIVNEFLTSNEASKQAQRSAGEPIDDIAAKLILEQFFSEKDRQDKV